ncbi:MAG: methylated-DNA--[protein]-cysteine S-methyltransferase [Thermodesulfovibrionales bacterium]
MYASPVLKVIKRQGSDIFFDTFHSPLGILYLVFHKGELAGINFEGEKPSCPKGRAPESFKKQLNDYFNGRLRKFSQGIVFLHGSDFEKMVWLTLKEIPYGETRTYKWLSERIGRPKAFRAVGQALSKNPIPIVLPCHRVIESDGSLGGYSPGVDVKRRLLDMEYYNLMES